MFFLCNIFAKNITHSVHLFVTLHNFAIIHLMLCTKSLQRFYSVHLFVSLFVCLQHNSICTVWIILKFWKSNPHRDVSLCDYIKTH